jgi:hypothetical protein
MIQIGALSSYERINLIQKKPAVNHHFCCLVPLAASSREEADIPILPLSLKKLPEKKLATQLFDYILHLQFRKSGKQF